VSLRAAAIQLSSQDDIEANLAACRTLLEQARDRGAELGVLPENFAFFGADSERAKVAEPLGDRSAPIQRTLSELALSLGMTIVGGGMPELSSDPARPFNTCVVFGPDGSIAAHYRKIHLFDVELGDGTNITESLTTSAGDRVVVASIAGRGVGLSICYDLRFPELYRKLVDQGAEVIVVPAAFTEHTGKHHWHALLRARAIESQAWVVAAAQWGLHPKQRTTYGHSLIVDPWGTVVAECSDGVGIIVAELDGTLTARVRNSLPSLRHRRL
jgi:deaminated glutathione amidase